MAAPLLYLLAWASLAGCASAGRRAIMRPGRSAALVYPGEPVPTPPSLRATNLHGLTDSSLWPAPISESHAASGDWVLLGSNTAGECGGPRAQHAQREGCARNGCSGLAARLAKRAHMHALSVGYATAASNLAPHHPPQLLATTALSSLMHRPPLSQRARRHAARTAPAMSSTGMLKLMTVSCAPARTRLRPC